ncbi:MAG: hypothetical protein M3417_06895 [Actinomycetota bacterium]|nr:hypothetical protein [Actinomycetota bacterium]
MLLEPRPLDIPAPTVRNKAVHVLVGCVVLATLSLLLPSTPTYDPWAWIVWGREITQLDLVTTAGPSWKPLPALFTVPFALFGDLAPSLWLVVARAGGLLGLFFAFRVAGRLGGAVAGAAAVGSLALAPWFFKNSALGNSEGLMAAAVLGAIDRHLSGHRSQAFGLGLAAALLRPEAWPFFGLYGLWLLWSERTTLKLVLVGFASLPALWLGPELWGSGNLNRASDRAQEPNSNSPAFADHPALEVLGNAWDMVTVPVAVAFGLVVVGLMLRRPAAAGQARIVGALAVMAVAWLGIVALMTSNGFSGNQRYLVMPVTLAVVVACVGVGWAARELFARVTLRGRPAVLLAAVAAVGFTAPHWGGAPRMWDNLAYQGRLLDDLERSVGDAGGPERLRACGATTGAFLVPAVAWQLGLHLNAVELKPERPTVIFRVSTVPGSDPVPPLGPLGGATLQTLAINGNWRLLGACS